MLLLIDGDIIVYRSAFGAQRTVNGVLEVDPEHYVKHSIRSTIERICKKLESEEVLVHLTATNDKTNFRLAIDPEYKANRKNFIKPVHYQTARDYLVASYPSVTAVGEEADDIMGVNQCSMYNTCIVSTDKDMDTIPGWHYNWVKDRLYFITNFDALKNFYTQLLTGDRADNVPGVGGIGPVKARRALERCTNEDELFERVRKEYHDKFADKASERLLRVGRLLWIRRRNDEVWSYPVGGSDGSEIERIE